VTESASIERGVPVKASDRALLTRWLTGLSLVQSAEFLVQREADVTAAVALITADAASESLLGLIASWSKLTRERGKHDNLIDRAEDALSKVGVEIDPGLLSDLRSTHAVRTNVVHDGATAGRTEALRSVRVGRALADLVPAISRRFAAIPVGGGLASGVALVIDNVDLAAPLRAADAAVARGAPKEALDAAARALGRAWYFTKPPLEGDRRRHDQGRATASLSDRDARAVIEDIGDIRERVNELLPWILAPAVGLQPAEYDRLVGLLGYHVVYSTYPTAADEVMQRVEEPSLADARWAVERVAQIVFRLWETGALTPRATPAFAEMEAVVAENRRRQPERHLPDEKGAAESAPDADGLARGT
jgi:hypothetical protein